MASERKLFNYLFYVRYPQICETVSHKFETPPEMLINKLSFSHIREIMKIEDPLERFFYEMESIKGTWSVRELRRQIDTKLFIRAGMSKNPDLVLYNRILHCNVIIELKVDKFDFSYASQLNAYVSYYKDCEMTEGDNPPIGILLCTQKGPKMVEYVLNGMDENLFVSTYMLQLPDKKQLEEFLVREMKELGI